MEQVEQLSGAIRSMGYNVETNADYIDSMKKQFAMVQAVLGGIGAVSLLVAAIGIANTMMMSIYERTKEIGVMKVIGMRTEKYKTAVPDGSGIHRTGGRHHRESAEPDHVGCDQYICVRREHGNIGQSVICAGVACADLDSLCRACRHCGGIFSGTQSDGVEPAGGNPQSVTVYDEESGGTKKNR